MLFKNAVWPLKQQTIAFKVSSQWLSSDYLSRSDNVERDRMATILQVRARIYSCVSPIGHPAKQLCFP